MLQTTWAVSPPFLEHVTAGVLTVRTGDGRTMRLRRVEYSKPDVNIALRELLLGSGRKYDEGVMMQLELPWRAEFGHHRYLLDAVQ